MITVNEKKTGEQQAERTLTLPFEIRQKYRFKAVLDNGENVGVMLPREGVLRGGEFLCADNGMLIEVQAADESVSTATTEDNHLFARACYHLGNRHVPLQIGDGWVRYQHDHVLDDMLVRLGLIVIHELAPFEPEAGAYHSHGHSGSHSYGHSHSHGHTHGHSHD